MGDPPPIPPQEATPSAPDAVPPIVTESTPTPTPMAIGGESSAASEDERRALGRPWILIGALAAALVTLYALVAFLLDD